jgi:hypothetical protein
MFRWARVRDVLVLLLTLYVLNQLDRQLRPPPPPDIQLLEPQTRAFTNWRTAFGDRVCRDDPISIARCPPPRPPPAWFADDGPICKLVRCHPPPPEEARCWKPARFETGQSVWLHVC